VALVELLQAQAGAGAAQGQVELAAQVAQVTSAAVEAAVVPHALAILQALVERAAVPE
jgi:hypothetical protein